MIRAKTLQYQYLSRLFIALLIISLITGSLQLFYIQKQISKQTEEQAIQTAKSIQQGLTETETATRAIERQIDLKLLSYDQRISDQLKGKPVKDITQAELNDMKESMNLTGITILAKQGNDIVGIQSTESNEIGFSTNKIPSFYTRLDNMLQDKPFNNDFSSFYQKNMYNLPIVQSGSHEKPSFFKYSYYHEPGSSYIIDPYIEANEVNQFTREEGPDAWIDREKESNNIVVEIAVLNPKVFLDPSLEKNLFPPMNKVVYGSYSYPNSTDTNLMKQIMATHQKVSLIDKQSGKKLYKMFIPTDHGQVIFIALDYYKMSGPLYQQSMILIVSGLVALAVLFILTVKFFGRIYRSIQLIKKQIKTLETGDFTVRSHLENAGELSELSESVNRTVDTLYEILKDTSEQARRTQQLSVLMEMDSGKSVENVYTISMETTTNERMATEEFLYFLDRIEEHLKMGSTEESEKQMLEQVDVIRDLVKNRTAATTDMTITLSDLLKSLHEQSSQLSEIANNLLQNISKFKLEDNFTILSKNWR